MLDITISHIPQELQHLNQWLIWRAETRSGSSKPTKVPYQSNAPSYGASTTSPATWSTLSEAVLSAQLNDASGIGFVFTESDPYIGIDVDKPEMVDEVLGMFNSYAERSVSGRGVHIIVKGKIPRGFNRQDIGVECYTKGRYFVFTGDKLPGSTETVKRDQAALDRFLDKYAPKNQHVALTEGLPGGTYDDSPPNRQKYLNYLEHQPRAVEGDSGDVATYKVACKGKDLGLSPQVVLDTLNGEGGWNSRCVPNWDIESLQDKVRSAYMNGQNAPGCDHSAVALGIGLPGRPAPAVAQAIPARVDTTNVVATRKPDDGSATLVALEDRLHGVDPSDLDGVESVLREAVYLSSELRAERIVSVLACEPFGLTKTYTRRMIKRYRGEAMQLMPQRGVAWVDTVGEDGAPLATADNLRQMMRSDGVELKWNDMNHGFEYNLGVKGTKLYDAEEGVVDENLGYAYIKNQCKLTGFPVDALTENLHLIANEEKYHPFKDYLDSEKWDGVTRIDKLLETLTVDARNLKLRKQLIVTWMISVVAAVRGYGDLVPKGVLVLVGGQSIGKTSWLRYLVPEGMFGEGLHLDPNNKDSLMKSTRHLVAELGELDGTFRKSDIASLKSHISSPVDEYRRPYDRGISTFKRQTIYAGTVNNPEFLQDDTGNVRFWPISVQRINLDTIQEMRNAGELLQIWLEVEDLYHSGQRLWYFERDELDNLLDHIDSYRELDTVEEMIMDLYAWDADPATWRTMTITSIKTELRLDINKKSQSNIIKRVITNMTQEYQPKVRQQEKGAVIRQGDRVIRAWNVPPLRSQGGPAHPEVSFL